MLNTSDKKIVFFGCPMDCDEQYESIQGKINKAWATNGYDDPFDGVMKHLVSDLSENLWNNMGTLPVPAWLHPKPSSKEYAKITTENFISFIDSNGCKKISDDVQQFVTSRILPDVPCLIGVDHSLTGGVYSALANHYDKKNLSLVIIDSHTDAIPMSLIAGAIQFDIETNSSSVHDRNDPFLYNRPDSYNASSFVHNLIKDKQVDPKNLYIIGVSDYPEKKFMRIKDPRMKKYANAYVKLKRKGATIITKKECKLNPNKIKGALKKISTSHVYLSIDMDIGANNALEGVRFRNWQGLNEIQIYKLADTIVKNLSGKTELAGMDICEIDSRIAGKITSSGLDKTYEIAANLIKKIAFSKE